MPRLAELLAEQEAAFAAPKSRLRELLEEQDGVFGGQEEKEFASAPAATTKAAPVPFSAVREAAPGVRFAERVAETQDYFGMARAVREALEPEEKFNRPATIGPAREPLPNEFLAADEPLPTKAPLFVPEEEEEKSGGFLKAAIRRKDKPAPAAPVQVPKRIATLKPSEAELPELIGRGLSAARDAALKGGIVAQEFLSAPFETDTTLSTREQIEQIAGGGVGVAVPVETGIGLLRGAKPKPRVLRGLGALKEVRDEFPVQKNPLASEQAIAPEEIGEIVSQETIPKALAGEILYHGSPTGELRFGQAKQGQQLPYGVHFTSDRAIAEDFASGVTKGKPTGKKGQVIEAKIAATKPFDISTAGIYRQGTEQFRVLEEIANRAKIKNIVRPYSEEVGTFLAEGSSMKGHPAIDPGQVLDNAPVNIVKSVLGENGYDLAIKYKMRGSRDPLGQGAPVYTDAIAVLDENLVKQAPAEAGVPFTGKPAVPPAAPPPPLEILMQERRGEGGDVLFRGSKKSGLPEDVVYLSRDKGVAEGHGEVTEYVAPNAKILNLNEDSPLANEIREYAEPLFSKSLYDPAATGAQAAKVENEFVGRFRNKILAAGYDGVELPGVEVQIYNPKVLQAKAVKPSPPVAPEAVARPAEAPKVKERAFPGEEDLLGEPIPPEQMFEAGDAPIRREYEQVRKEIETSPEVGLPEEPAFGRREMGIKNEELNFLREGIGLEKLEPAKRKKTLEAIAEAKAEGLVDKGMDIAQEVLQTARPIHGKEEMAMALKLAEKRNQYSQMSRNIEELIGKGDQAAADLEKARREIVIQEHATLSDALRVGKTEAARTLVYAKSFFDLDNYDYTGIRQRATEFAGRRLTPDEVAKFDGRAAEIEALHKQIDEVTAKWQEGEALREKQIAERVVAAESKRATTARTAKGTKEKLAGELDAALKDLAALGYRVNDITGLTAEGAYRLGKVALVFAKQGIFDIRQIAQKVLERVPDLQERDVWQALAAKDPKRIAKAKNDVAKRIQALRTQGRLLLEIEQAEQGIFAPPKGKTTQPAEIRALQEKLGELRKQAYKSTADGRKLERALQTINELQDQLDNHRRAAKAKRPLEPAELQAAKDKANTLRKIMRAEDEIAKLDEQLRTGDVKVEIKEPKAIPPELERLQVTLKRKRRQVDEMVAGMKPKSVASYIGEFPDILRSMRATGEFSLVGRQGFPLVAMAPGKVPKAFTESVRALLSEHKAEAIMNFIESQPDFYISQKAGLHMSDVTGFLGKREEFFNSRVAERLPVIGRLIKASNRQGATFLNLMRQEVFKQFSDAYPNATSAELAAWADFINKASGKGDLSGVNGAVKKVLSLGLFAPGYTASRWQTPMTLVKYRNMPRVRKEIAKGMVKTTGLGGSVLTLAYLAGAEVGTDPRSPDWGKIRIGDTRYDIWAGFQQITRLMTLIGMSATDRTGLTGGHLPEDLKDIIPSEALWNFAQYKRAPVVSLTEELITGKTAVGEDVEPTEAVARSFLPMFWEDIYDAYRLEGGEGLLKIAPAAGGAGVQTYPDSKKALKLKRIQEAQ